MFILGNIIISSDKINKIKNILSKDENLIFYDDRYILLFEVRTQQDVFFAKNLLFYLSYIFIEDENDIRRYAEYINERYVDTLYDISYYSDVDSCVLNINIDYDNFDNTLNKYIDNFHMGSVWDDYYYEDELNDVHALKNFSLNLSKAFCREI